MDFSLLLSIRLFLFQLCDSKSYRLNRNASFYGLYKGLMATGLLNILSAPMLFSLTVTIVSEVSKDVLQITKIGTKSNLPSLIQFSYFNFKLKMV